MQHCWACKAYVAYGRYGARSREYRDALDHPAHCLRPRGHPGPHRWTFDGDVVFTPTGDGTFLIEVRVGNARQGTPNRQEKS